MEGDGKGDEMRGEVLEWTEPPNIFPKSAPMLPNAAWHDCSVQMMDGEYDTGGGSIYCEKQQ